jgi:hypothetical protein
MGDEGAIALVRVEKHGCIIGPARRGCSPFSDIEMERSDASVHPQSFFPRPSSNGRNRFGSGSTKSTNGSLRRRPVHRPVRSAHAARQMGREGAGARARDREGARPSATLEQSTLKSPLTGPDRTRPLAPVRGSHATRARPPSEPSASLAGRVDGVEMTSPVHKCLIAQVEQTGPRRSLPVLTIWIVALNNTPASGRKRRTALRPPSRRGNLPQAGEVTGKEEGRT